MEPKDRIERSVLVTGATGFLGGELLGRLLLEDSCDLICIVRADNDRTAASRGLAAMEKALGRAPSDRERRRVTWLRGDLSQRDLGLRTEQRARLVRSVSEIYHCAASVRFDLSIEQARTANLVGTRSMLALANEAMCNGRFRRFHHVSTAYVAGVFRGSRPAAPVIVAQARFRNTYERSKAEAETYLAENSEVPLTIYRPSIIVGNSQTGRTCSWNVVYYPIKLMAAGVLTHAPGDPQGLLDCVPVDYVADAILALGARDDSDGDIFHITAGGRALTCAQVIAHTYAGIAVSEGRPMRVRTRLIGNGAWIVLKHVLSWFGGSDTRAALRSFEMYAPYTRIHGVHENSRETALLARCGVGLPNRDDFFARAVAYALETDFGRRDVKSPTSPPLRGTRHAAATRTARIRSDMLRVSLAEAAGGAHG